MSAKKAASSMTVSEAGRMGGVKVRDSRPADYFQKIGSLGGSKTRERHGPDFYREIGERGGNITKQKGTAYFEEMGKKGSAKLKRIVAAGKEALAQQEAEEPQD